MGSRSPSTPKFQCPNQDSIHNIQLVIVKYSLHPILQRSLKFSSTSMKPLHSIGRYLVPNTTISVPINHVKLQD
jgi:hypothetical protein